MIRRQRILGRGSHQTEVYGAPCIDPEKHKDTTRTEKWGDECWHCSIQWHEALPWVRSFFDASRYDDDEALMALLQIPKDVRKKKRLSVVYRNCWGHLDADHQGYATELFGAEIGESETPDSYPYWRLTQKASPKMIIPILRNRICYEPQIKTCPIYLEIVYFGLHREINMHGLDSVEDLRPSDLKYLLRARDWLLDKDNKDDVELWGAIRNQRGGDRRPKAIQELWTDENLRRFAALVDKLTPKWQWVKLIYDPHFSTPQEWCNDARDRTEFAGMFSGCKGPTDDLLLQLTDSDLRRDDLEPRALACLHAAYELECIVEGRRASAIDHYQAIMKKIPASSTLRNWYAKGSALR